MTIAPREFRNAVSHFPTGVAVVTAESGPIRLGITVSSLVSVSLDPPLLSFCFARALRSYETFEASRHFAVNVLRREQRALSRQFAGSGADKWKNIEPGVGVTGAPILEGSLAIFECEHHDTFVGGDHYIVLGRVLHIHTSEEEKPLVFFRSAYHALGSREVDEI